LTALLAATLATVRRSPTNHAALPGKWVTRIPGHAGERSSERSVCSDQWAVVSSRRKAAASLQSAIAKTATIAAMVEIAMTANMGTPKIYLAVCL
jgi:hypothetical protein